MPLMMPPPTGDLRQGEILPAEHSQAPSLDRDSPKRRDAKQSQPRFPSSHRPSGQRRCARAFVCVPSGGAWVRQGARVQVDVRNFDCAMAFVTRSRRETEIAIEQASTTPLVGPGAYCNLGSYSTDHGYAPFSSTERRGLADGGETSVDLKPGPGFYAREVVEPAVMRKASSNAFVSKVSRFAREVSTSKRSPAAMGALGDLEHLRRAGPQK